MSETPPPLRVREDDGTPNVIPTYEMIFSGATLTRRGPTTVVVSVDSGASGAGSASSAASYVTIAPEAGLTNERVLTASTGINITSDTTTVFIHYGSLLVTSSRTLTVLFPISGGGNLSADRTFAVDTAFLLNSGRTITTTLPLSGGGNLSADRTFSIVTANNTTTGAIQASDFKDFNLGRVTTDRTITTLYPLTGGGLNLSADRTFSLDTAFLVNTGRTINTTLPLSGGGTLAADRTFSIVTANNTTTGAIQASDFKDFNLGRVTTDRTITTLYPLTGGGLNLSADRTFSVDTAFLVNTGRTLNTTLPLSGGGTLAADRTLTIVTANATTTGAITGADWKAFNAKAPSSLTYLLAVADAGGDLSAERAFVASSGLFSVDGGANDNFFVAATTAQRERLYGFYVAGDLGLANATQAMNARWFITRSVRLIDAVVDRVTVTAIGLTANVFEFSHADSLGVSLFANAASMPQILANQAAGSSLAFNKSTLTIGSFLGIRIETHPGVSTAMGSDLTLTLVCRMDY